MRLNLQNDSMDNEEPMEMSIRFLQEITDDFSQKRIVGSGSFGTVYKGVTKNGDMAVKLLHSMPGIDDKLFRREFNNLTELNHPNIVQLLGYCDETEKVAVVYNGELITALKVHRALCLEYMQGGSLEKYISDVDQGFDWPRRYKIIKGICEGLKYLHTGGKNPIYHLDLKPANILLDENMVPRIADFGLSRLLVEGNTTRTIWDGYGTLGYVPPEYISHQIISEGFDIFSLGVIIMNIVTGPAGYSLACDMEPAKVIEHACKKWRERLQVVQGYTLLETECQQVRKCIEIALKCIDANRRRRPPMRYIVSQLTEIEKQSNDTPSGIEVDQKFDDQESSLPNNNFQGQHSPGKDLQTAASGSQTQNLTGLQLGITLLKDKQFISYLAEHEFM